MKLLLNILFILFSVFYFNSCVPKKSIGRETFKLRLKDGTEFERKIEWCDGIFSYPPKEQFASILRDLSKGKKVDLNVHIKNTSCSLLEYERGFKERRYLLEKGADPNLLEAYPSDNLTISHENYDETTGKIRFGLPLASASSRLKIFDYDLLEYVNNIDNINQIILLLAYGAKIKLKDYLKRTALSEWEKENQGKEFATKVCEGLLKEDDITKLDPDFIDYAEEKGVDRTIIEKLRKKSKIKLLNPNKILN